MSEILEQKEHQKTPEEREKERQEEASEKWREAIDKNILEFQTATNETGNELINQAKQTIPAESGNEKLYNDWYDRANDQFQTTIDAILKSDVMNDKKIEWIQTALETLQNDIANVPSQVEGVEASKDQQTQERNNEEMEKNDRKRQYEMVEKILEKMNEQRQEKLSKTVQQANQEQNRELQTSQEAAKKTLENMSIA